MKFEENAALKKWGQRIGFAVGILIFISIFYLIMQLLGKLPSLEYWHLFVAAAVVYVIYLVVKR